MKSFAAIKCFLRDSYALGGIRDVIRYRDFDDENYLARYPDVMAGVRDGRIPSGRFHFIKHGRAEGRSASYDPRRALAQIKRALPERAPSNIGRSVTARDAFLKDLGDRVAVGAANIARELATGGEDVIKLNRFIVNANKQATVERYGRQRANLCASLITCLYGSPHLLQIHVALFSASQLFDQVEFIYVNNSPEYAEAVAAEARQSARLYDATITIVTPRANLGFGAANNIAATHARSERVILANPDVFPKDPDWLVKHNAFAASKNGTFFGACLYYDDGSVMHAGMYFRKDTFNDGSAHPPELLRVEHYAKGFPDWVEEASRSRIVPAVTGAFMSIDRAHFERLGGFDEDYIFGHYEDADICLRSSKADIPVWYCADVKLWHMEGKGSTRRAEHEGATQVNRWLFTRKWLGDAILKIAA